MNRNNARPALALGALVIAAVGLLTQLDVARESGTAQPTGRMATVPQALTVGSPSPTRQAPAVSPTAAQPSSPSGEYLQAADLPGWDLVFSDDFDDVVANGAFPATVATRWTAYPSPWKDTSSNGTYSPEIVSFHDSMMDIYLHTAAGTTKVAAPIPLTSDVADRRHQLYGRYAVRFRADPIPGFKTAWLLWPESEAWPRDGEINFPEGSLDGTIHAYMHRQGATKGTDQVRFSTKARYSDWHTAVIEWTPYGCEFFLDGRSIGRATGRVPETPMRWVIQTETDLTGRSPTPQAEGHVYLDWVAVWAYAP
jgi:beta-glucanase (GH16 family)